jgi:menaquinone-dependent protoporphyrinogen oxidase
MEKVLVVYASRQGATGEIARAVMEELTNSGLDVDLRPMSEAPSVTGYDAVVVGSATQLRHWDREAMHFLDTHAADLAHQPTWLFQSGPYGRHAGAQHSEPPHAVIERAAQIGAQAPKVFTGNLSGSIRNCDEVRNWTDSIAEKVLSGQAMSV